MGVQFWGTMLWKSFNCIRWLCLVLDPDFCYGCSFVSLLPCSYHRLMVSQYYSKREKFQMVKKRSTEEQRLVCELEQAMDVELFLELQNSWPEDSPIALWSYMKCSDMLQLKGGRRQSKPSAKAASSTCPSWTLRQVHLPSSWWDQRPLKKSCWSYI